ncbi:hypothetical protein VOLCADRAFT_121494 [Volvox carteri f. nagariensis]|uniref:Uncharacterized protein n=1 Tax=Volvox carteri f. nagariensis TaxID=3068 RepID=D8UC35_VOLCA|nr:uncharacterized protein VOLCADRAFT_121494 [Volvox carteri f. nagariensis]EFJ42777.1 hypothetical protein VOLCADRAFT_121494 [Volvox carteri f. nagariensis]|eukprot:XP_002956238.1 hypothetical protein VOLCADRAFT_121494 [Volvox carteri f. nagariensis]
MVAVELTKATEEAEVLEPLTRAADEEQEPATCMHFLSPFQPDDTGTAVDLNATSTQVNKHKLVVTCLSWSATGQTIAASYGRYDVVGWCTFPGALCTWNLGREEVNTCRPDQRIDTDTCLMSCAFHPAHPALIAGGTFNGELYVWDLSTEGDQQRGRSDVLLDVRHMEPILNITWQYNLTGLTPNGRRPERNPRVAVMVAVVVMVVVVVAAVAVMVVTMLVVIVVIVLAIVIKGGGDSGPQFPAAPDTDTSTGALELFRSAEFTRAVAAGERVELRTPVREANYQTHAGAVFGLDCSPFQRELFLTSSTDGSVRLYSSLRMQPLLHLEPTAAYLFAVQWSPFRPLVFAAAAADGCVYMYDLIRGHEIIRPVLTLDANGMRKPVYALAFNPRKPDLLATGDTTGIQIWRLPSSLTAARRGEETLLSKLAQADDVPELLKKRAGR